MLRSNRKSLGLLLGGMLVASVLVAPSPALAAPDPCGVTVEYTAWRALTGAGANQQRRWYWSYYNCGTSTVKKKAMVDLGSDSKCFSIKGRGYATFNGYETWTVGVRSNRYTHTVNC
ncbi:hypothetical protein ACI2K4_27980 [Micromonospora sp. NPDC050397]|uniref:hypothetical protein n=1 Tax=Micromonospora sp. NPDC050397 TaxID=3364279 RepID=UPI00384D9C81